MNMTNNEFANVIEKVLEYLSEDCKRHPEKYRKSGIKGIEFRS